MKYTEPAYLVYNELVRLILKAGNDPINKWFFTDGAFPPETQLQISPNTWQHENFVVVANRQILAYFEAYWSNPLDIITSFRMIFFEKDKSVCIARALFEYFEYLFVIRGCKALNWIVAEKNYHAYRIYEKFIKKYFGHRVGKRQYGQMAYNFCVRDCSTAEGVHRRSFATRRMTVREVRKARPQRLLSCVEATVVGTTRKFSVLFSLI